MDTSTMNQAPTRQVRFGNWSYIKDLGQGGFGKVTLWENLSTKKCIALKQCRVTSEMTHRHMTRWMREVEIMQKLDMPTVIRGLPVPDAFKSISPEVPLMGMEYCNGGNLRSTLSNAENCCGMKESEVLVLVRDIATAVEYLHMRRIIHRDLKPENIVLHKSGDETVYKVIDLGYAKDLENGSMCTSYVGTLHYLAPELFENNTYNCTVDYWSLGITIFETLCGFRPFLPQLHPAQAMEYLKRKDSDVICITVGPDKRARHETSIPYPNQLGRINQLCFEQWLRLMLRWNPEERGGGISKEKKRARCFHLLELFLAHKILKVYSVPTNQYMTYRLSDEIIGFIQQLLQRETGIDIMEQELLLSTGHPVDKRKKAETIVFDTKDDVDGLVFLFKKYSESSEGDLQAEPPRNEISLPPVVQDMIANPEVIMPYADMKRCWAQALHYCRQVSINYDRLMAAHSATRTFMIRTYGIFSKRKAALKSDCDKLHAQAKFFKSGLEYDVEQAKEIGQKPSQNNYQLIEDWNKSLDEADTIIKMRDVIRDYDNKCTALTTMYVELQKSPGSRSRQNGLGAFISKATALYDKLRRLPKDKRNTIGNQQMVGCVKDCRTESTRLVHEAMALIRNTNKYHYRLQSQLPKQEELQKKLGDMSGKLCRMQKKRQEQIWQLMNSLCEKATNGIQTSEGRKAQESISPLAGPTSDVSGLADKNPTHIVSQAKPGVVDLPVSLFEKCKEQSIALMNSNSDATTRAEQEIESLNELLKTDSIISNYNWDFLEAFETRNKVVQNAPLSRFMRAKPTLPTEDDQKDMVPNEIKNQENNLTKLESTTTLESKA